MSTIYLTLGERDVAITALEGITELIIEGLEQHVKLLNYNTIEDNVTVDDINTSLNSVKTLLQLMSELKREGWYRCTNVSVDSLRLLETALSSQQGMFGDQVVTMFENHRQGVTEKAKATFEADLNKYKDTTALLNQVETLIRFS